MCPSGRSLQSDVEELEGQPVFTEHAADALVLVRGSIEDLTTGVHVQIEAHAADGALLGTRELRAPAGDCASLRRALSLVLILLIDREEQLEVRPSARRRVLHVGAELGMLSGALPRATPGVALAFGAEVSSRLRLRADASYWLPVAIESAHGVGAAIGALGLGLALCPRLSRDARGFGVWLCAGTQLGGLSAVPHQLHGPQRQTRLLAEALVELKWSVRIHGRGSLEASVGPFVSLSRPRFSYLGHEAQSVSVYRPSALGAILRLAIIIDRL
ncbi:MAG: hypothetical protein JWN04_3799 [Myxococcaceae bacterium]|nr:hypothetical protein [Myxococcaceae bacterium]